MPEDAERQAAKYQPRITVDYGKGRWGKVFHLFGLGGGEGEIVLPQKDAVSLAKSILKIAKRKEK